MFQRKHIQGFAQKDINIYFEFTGKLKYLQLERWDGRTIWQVRGTEEDSGEEAWWKETT
jgi:hypothetical protein